MMGSNAQIWKAPDEVRQLFEKVQTYTYLVESKLSTLIRLGEYLNNAGIPGDFVECGVYKGGSAAVLSRCLGPLRHLWLYDSFEGLPETSARDGEVAKEWIGKCLASVEEVREVMAAVSTGPERYTIREGWFHDTFKDTLPSQVALLHCDSDWYESVSLVLETFYPLVPDGGCVILDDFGFWEGCREAFYEFCHRHGEKPLLERVERDQAFWIKKRTCNRILIPNLLDTHERDAQIYLYSEEAKKAQLETAAVKQEIAKLRQQMEAEKSLQIELEATRAQELATLHQQLQELEAARALELATLQQKLQELETARAQTIATLQQKLQEQEAVRAQELANLHQKLLEQEIAHVQTITTLQQKLQEQEIVHAQRITALQEKHQLQDPAYRLEVATLQQKLQEQDAVHAQMIATLQQKLHEQEISHREHILSLEEQLEREHSARAENDANRHRAESMAQELRARIAAMESSKFWKLRRIWFRLKGAVGLAAE